MKLIDVLLVACIACLTVAGFLASTPLGLAAVGCGCGGAWWLFSDDGAA